MILLIPKSLVLQLMFLFIFNILDFIHCGHETWKSCLLVSLRSNWTVVSIVQSANMMMWVHPGGDFTAGVTTQAVLGEEGRIPSSQKQQHHKLSEPEVPVGRLGSHPEFKITPPCWHLAAGWRGRRGNRRAQNTQAHNNNRLATRPSLLQVLLKTLQNIYIYLISY